MELKIVSFNVAKAIKEAGYQQGYLTEVYLMSAIEKELAYREFGLFPKDYFPGELVSAGSYSKYDVETCDAPTYLEVWLWLWREKKMPIECVKDWTTSNWYFNIVDLVKLTDTTGVESSDYLLYSDPEEAIISAINYLAENDLIK